MLPKDQIRDLKKILEDRFVDLREEIRLELLESDDQTYIALAGQVHDTGEASVADLLVDLQFADIDRHIQEIRDIDAALLRIAGGSYSVCIDCHITIDIGRLQAYPTAKRCHRCQVNHEHVYARVSGPSM
jgi:RNA polymerase-binding transcription factor DksA